MHCQNINNTKIVRIDYFYKWIPVDEQDIEYFVKDVDFKVITDTELINLFVETKEIPIGKSYIPLKLYFNNGAIEYVVYNFISCSYYSKSLNKVLILQDNEHCEKFKSLIKSNF